MFKANFKLKKAFTLVELIIVITILAILSTVAFVSFQNYTVQSRDANRISSLKTIEKGILVSYETMGKYPTPDNYVNILFGGSVIGYQGYAGDNVLKLIKGSKALDPVDNNYYTYGVNSTYKKYELMTFLEKKDYVYNNQVFASYENRYPKVLGDKIGIILDTKNTPIQDLQTQVDIATTTGTYTAVLDGTTSITGTGITLGILKVGVGSSCNDLLTNNPTLKNQDGAYYITTSSGNTLVYCDMTTNGGGRTLTMKFKSSGSTFGYDSTYWDNDTTLNTSSVDLTDSDAKYGIYSTLTGSSILMCMNNSGIKCYSKTYNGTLKSFVALPTTTQFNYINGVTTSQLEPDSFVSKLGLLVGYNTYCDGHTTKIYAMSRLGFIKNDGYEISHGITSDPCSGTDGSYGFGLKNTNQGISAGAGVTGSFSSDNMILQGFIYVK